MTDTRRNVLRLGGTTLATLSLAGCLGDGTGTEAGDASTGGEPEATSTDASTSTASATETSTPTETATARHPAMSGQRPETPLVDYTDWHPAPSAIEFTRDTGYAFLAMAPAALVDRADELGDGAVDGFDRELPNPGIETLGDATTIHQFARSCVVYEADFDRANAEAEFEDLGFSAADTYRGFSVFTIGSDARAGAISDDAVVTVGRFASSDDTDKRPALEAIIDAKTGNADRYADASDDCAALTAGLGNAHVVQGRTHEVDGAFDGAVGEGVATHVGPADTRMQASVVFAEGSADESAVSDWADDAETFEDREETVRTDGRVVTAATLVPTGDVTAFPDDFPGSPLPSERTSRIPQVNFEFEYAETGDEQGILTIAHYGGDAVSADELSVRGEGFADVSGADQTAAGPWQGSASGDDNSVVAGDAVDVGVASDYEIQVVFASESGDVSATLGSHEGPDS